MKERSPTLSFFHSFILSFTYYRFRSFQQWRSKPHPYLPRFAGGLYISQQTSVVGAMSVVGVVAHIAVVRAFQPQQACRTFDGARYLIVAKLHHYPLFVNNFHREVRYGMATVQLRAVCAYPERIRPAG